jgi:hypothetical protein
LLSGPIAPTPSIDISWKYDGCVAAGVGLKCQIRAAKLSAAEQARSLILSTKQQASLTASCRCGTVVLHVEGAPIVHTACYCKSCQQAGLLIEQLPGAPPVLDHDNGTDFVLYRKDRVRCVQGGERLQTHRLKPESPTRRMVATCCNSAMFLDFTKGHWLTLYRARLPPQVPPLEMRVMTADRPKGVELPQDVPNHAGHTGKLMWKLLTARLAMGFRAAKVEGVPA